jgi:hypothetical protein
MMKLINCVSRAVPMTAIILGGQALFAQDLPIVNPNFDDPSTTSWTQGSAGSSTAITGWTISGGGNAGVGDVSGLSSLFALPPSGTQIGYINPIGLTTVSQTLTTDLQPNETYTLQIDVTGRSDGENPGTGYAVGLYAGGSLLTSVTPETPEYGSWTLLTATFTTGSSVPSDDPLSIEISDWTSGGQLDFSDVTVVDPPAGGGTVPDGGVTAMLLAGSLGALGWLRRKI